MAHSNIQFLDEELLPVKITRLSNKTKVKGSQLLFTKDIKEFGVSERYFKAEPKNNTIVLAEAEDGSPIIAIAEHNNGNIIYYGILDGFSNFKTSIHYPIFWNDMMNFLVRTEDLSDYNFNTGRIIPVETQTVTLPSGEIETSKVFFDEAGIYQIGRKKIAASLLNEKESDVSQINEQMVDEHKEFYVKETEEKEELSFEYLLIIIAALVILAELMYIKMRGDL